jgi:hypothetical protein
MNAIITEIHPRLVMAAKTTVLRERPLAEKNLKYGLKELSPSTNTVITDMSSKPPQDEFLNSLLPIPMRKANI